MPQYRVTERAFVNNSLVEAGAILDLPDGFVKDGDKHLVKLDGKQRQEDAKAQKAARDRAKLDAEALREKAKEARAASDAVPGRTDLAAKAAEAEAKADEAEAALGPSGADDLL